MVDNGIPFIHKKGLFCRGGIDTKLTEFETEPSTNLLNPEGYSSRSDISVHRSGLCPRPRSNISRSLSAPSCGSLGDLHGVPFLPASAMLCRRDAPDRKTLPRGGVFPPDGPFRFMLCDGWALRTA